MQMLNEALARASLFWLRLKRLAPADEGQTLAEYSLIISAISVAVVTLALLAFRTELGAAFQSVTHCLTGTC